MRDDERERSDDRSVGKMRWRELYASFDGALRACVEPPTAQVGDSRARADAVVPPGARRRRRRRRGRERGLTIVLGGGDA